MDDIPLLIKVVLSTASKERVIIFDYLLQRNGLVETAGIEEHLMITEPTALRTMTQFMVLGMVKKIELGNDGTRSPLLPFKLHPKFDWFLSEEFKNLRNNFGKEYHKELIDEKMNAYQNERKGDK